MDRRKIVLGISVLLIVMFNHTDTQAQTYPMSDPNNTQGWKINSTFSDEFDGTELDKTKWWILGENGDYRTKWKGRAPGQFASHNM